MSQGTILIRSIPSRPPPPPIPGRAIFVTHSGKAINLCNPIEEDITIGDIAYALDRIMRFNGHTEAPYTVAQHLLVCHEIAKELYPQSQEIQDVALLHDAAEAYIGDLISPIKKLCPAYKAIENRIEFVIMKKFGLPDVSDETKACVKIIDRIAIISEMSVLYQHPQVAMSEWHIQFSPGFYFEPKAANLVRQVMQSKWDTPEDVWAHRAREILDNRQCPDNQ